MFTIKKTNITQTQAANFGLAWPGNQADTLEGRIRPGQNLKI